MKFKRIGVDLAKQVFQVHGVDSHEQVVCRKQLKRAQMLDFFRQCEPCLVAMEACGSAHYWARELRTLGHEVRLIAPQFVKPYVKSGKNDANDAEAICEAASRPTMRYVEVKSVEQQASQALHRIRSRLIRARTALVNEIRGLLGEFGLIAVQRGTAATRRLIQTAMEDAENGLPGQMRELLSGLQDELDERDAHLSRLDGMIQRQSREDERVKRLLEVEGIGPISATAIVSAVGDARQFSNARQFAAWLGLVPRQHSSGGKERLGSINKQGDTYLRTLLIHGARAVLRHCQNKEDRRSEWLQQLLCRRNMNIATVALANKNARIVWAILSRGENYQPDRAPQPA
jgi:transposase